jgi:hypothetical protein
MTSVSSFPSFYEHPSARRSFLTFLAHTTMADTIAPSRVEGGSESSDLAEKAGTPSLVEDSYPATVAHSKWLGILKAWGVESRG